MFDSATTPLFESSFVAVVMSIPSRMRSATRRISPPPVYRSGGRKLMFGKQHVAREIAAFEQQAGRDPALALRPSRHGRRREKLLPQRARDGIEVRHAGNTREAEFLICRHGQFHRPLDVRAHRRRAIEVARQEDLLEQRCDLVVVLPQHRPQLLLQLRRQVLAHEVAVDLRRR